MSTTPLRPVTDTERAAAPEGLPDFEGQHVELARLKLTGVGDLEARDEPNRMDDLVRLYIEGHVVRVDHVVDARSGQLKRIHTIKVSDAIQLPWNFDTGAFDE